MKTVLYNKDNGSMSREYEGGYIVDGHPGWLPDNMVELTIAYAEQPEYDSETEYLTGAIEVDLENNQLIHSWEIKQYSAYEIAIREWHHPEFPKRIKIPKVLNGQNVLEYYPSIALHMLVNGLPIESDDTHYYLYMRVILPEHQSLVDSLSEYITVEFLPES